MDTWQWKPSQRVSSYEPCKSTTYACFECRKHRSRVISGYYETDEVNCSQCQRPMRSIGYRLQVPRHDDTKQWDNLWKQWISPGYGPKGVPGVDEENKHLENCKAKNSNPPRLTESTGCGRCDKVWSRMPEGERERWRTDLKEYWRSRPVWVCKGYFFNYRDLRAAYGTGPYSVA